jgi:hypothetical protein
MATNVSLNSEITRQTKLYELFIAYKENNLSIKHFRLLLLLNQVPSSYVDEIITIIDGTPLTDIKILLNEEIILQ